MNDSFAELEFHETVDFYPEKPTVFNNRYVLGKEVNTGGLCAVYDVVDLYSAYFDPKKNLVIKIPLEPLMQKKDVTAFVYAEYSILSKLCHKNIVRVVDFGIDEESKIPYIVMHKLEGSLLSNTTLTHLSVKNMNRLVVSLVKVIFDLHSLQIVHADINPTNIMISKNLSITLFDFGIANVAKSEKDVCLDYTRHLAYNPHYAAPEIFLGVSPSIKTDVFSLACVIYEIYTGQLPFAKKTITSHKQQLHRRDFQDIPFFLRTWLRNALQSDPSLRPHKMPLLIQIKSFFNIFSKKY
jgi:serine/threonine protein kinase